MTPVDCTRCQGTGFLNTHQLNIETYGSDIPDLSDPEDVLFWIKTHVCHDVQVCDCCGDGESEWRDVPGSHYNSDDPPGPDGPYAYNGGFCECH